MTSKTGSKSRPRWAVFAGTGSATQGGWHDLQQVTITFETAREWLRRKIDAGVFDWGHVVDLRTLRVEETD